MSSKHKPKSNANTVQGTNDSSILSKHAMCEAGYASDPFLEVFTLKRAPRRAPLINRGYYIRSKAVETVLHAFLKQNGNHSPKQIISVGAGFDTTFFKLSTHPLMIQFMQDIYFVEIDFPAVADRKKVLIENDIRCISLLTPQLDSMHDSLKLCTSRYCLIGLDLADIANLEKIFDSETRLERNVPTLILSECVMTYMNSDLSTELINFSSNFFSKLMFVTYEQVEPDDAFGIFMQAHFNKLNSSLKGITKYPDKTRQKERYLSCGYEKVDVITMKEFFDSLSPDEINRISQLEYFDEYEEWNLKCFHYVLIVARSDCDSFTGVEQVIRSVPLHNNHGMNLSGVALSLSSHCTTGAEQFGHSSAVVTAGSMGRVLLTHGGFGATNSKHCRQNEIRMYSVSVSDDSCTYLSSTDLLPSRLHHTLTSISASQVFVFGGRLSPAKPFADPVILTVGDDLGAGVETCVEAVAGSGNQPEPRWRHAAVYVDIDGVGHVIVTGGLTVSPDSQASVPLSTCYLFNTVTSCWSCLPSYPQPLHSHSMCHSDGRYVYSVGGLCSQEKVLTDSYRLDISCMADGWHCVDIPHQPVYGHTLHAVDGKLVIVGGVDIQGQQQHIQIINLVSLQHSQVLLPVTVNDSLRMYINHTSHILEGVETPPKLMIVGGGGNCFSFGTHINKLIDILSLDDAL